MLAQDLRYGWRSRTFAADEEWQGKDDVVVISAGLWRRRFGGDPAIVGRPVSLDGRARTVIGVLPAGFRFNNAPIDVWIPMGWTQQSVATTRRPHYLRAVARLQPGVSVEQAQADMHRIARSLEERYPSTNTHMDVGVGPLQEWMVGPSRRALHLSSAPWRLSCSSPAPTSPISCSPAARPEHASSRSGRRWAPVRHGSCARCSPKACCSPGSAGCSAC